MRRRSSALRTMAAVEECCDRRHSLHLPPAITPLGLAQCPQSTPARPLSGLHSNSAAHASGAQRYARAIFDTTSSARIAREPEELP